MKVSVILPVYNVENFLEKCLDSLVNQTLEDIEIICVNDGSSDASLEILKSYQAKDSRIIIIDVKENHNTGYARNQGLKIARGEYLAFLDSDDFYDVKMLELAYNRSKELDADVCIYKSFLYDDITGEIRPNTWSVKQDLLPQSSVFCYSDVRTNIFKDIMCWPWDKLFKRSFIIQNNIYFQEQRTTNDMYFVYSALLKAEKITVLDNYLYYQRRNVKTSLSNSRELSWDCFYYALKKLYDELISMGIYDELENEFKGYCVQTCLWNLKTLDEPYSSELSEMLINAWLGNLGIDEELINWAVEE